MSHRPSPTRGRAGALALLALVAASVAAPGRVGAQSPTVRTEADTTLITVGDRVTLTITVDHTPDETVTWPDSVDIGPFEVLAAEAPAPAVRDGRAISVLRLTLTAFELGDLEVPRLDFAVTGPDGAVQAVSSDAYGISVVSVGLDEGQNIRDIRGPLSIPVGIRTVGPWLLLLLLAAALGYWLWRRRRARAGAGEAVAPEPALPANVLALQALEALGQADLLQRGEVKIFYVEVSEIIRTYVERLYRVPALEMTTGEVIQGLRRVGVDSGMLERFGSFLDRCDLVKFAKMRPASEASHETLQAARSIVEDCWEQVERERRERESAESVGTGPPDAEPRDASMTASESQRSDPPAADSEVAASRAVDSQQSDTLVDDPPSDQARADAPTVEEGA